MTIPTQFRQWYSIYAAPGTTVTATVKGKTYTLAIVGQGGPSTFQAISDSVEVSAEDAVILPSDAPIGAAVGGGTATQTWPLISGAATTLGNGQIYTLRQSELIVEAAAAVGKVRVDSTGEQQVKVGGTLTIDNRTFVCKDESGHVIDFNDDIVKVINADDSCAVTAAEAYPYMVLTAKTAGAAGNDIVLTSDGGWPIEQEMSGGQDANDGSSIDLSALTIGSAVTTAEIWIDCDGETAPDVVLPTAWVWPNESDTAQQPALTAGKKHIFVVRRVAEGDTGVIANLAQIY